MPAVLVLVLVLVLVPVAPVGAAPASAPADAGPDEVTTAGETGTAAGEAEPEPGLDPSGDDLEAFRRHQVALLDGKLAVVKRQLEAVQGLDPTLPAVPALLPGGLGLEQVVADLLAVGLGDEPPPLDLGSADAVDSFLPVLDRGRQGLAVAAADARAVEAAVVVQWSVPAPVDAGPAPDLGRRRRRPGATPDAGVASIDADPVPPPPVDAQLERVRRERELAEARVILLDAIRVYLVASQPARREAEAQDSAERAIAERDQQAERARREAAAARQSALEEQERAASLAEASLRKEEAAMHEVAEQLARFERVVVLAREREIGREHDRLSAQEAELAKIEPAATRYQDVQQALLEARFALVPARLLDLLAAARWPRPAPPVPAPPPVLSEEVRELPGEYQAAVTELEHLRDRLEREAARKREEVRELWRAWAALRYLHLGKLYALRIDTRAQLAPEHAAVRAPLSASATIDELRGELAQVVIALGYWASRRLDAARAGLGLLRDLSVIGELLWWLFDIVVIVLLLRFCLRGWDGWMQRLVEFIGTTLPVGPWTLTLARLCDFARAFGPPLLWLGAARVVYWQLGQDHGDAGIQAPPEAEVGYRLVFWVALFRALMHFIDRLSRYFEQRAHERAREYAELQAQDSAFAEEHPGEASDQPPPAPESAPVQVPWPLLARAWRILSGYLAVVFILLSLVEYGLDRGVLWTLATRYAWWGGVLLLAICLHVWRAAIADVVAGRLAREGALARLTARHGRRLYGAVVSALALVVVLAHRLGLFVRDEVAGLDATKRLLAFLFRRRVEKQAAERGRVLEQPLPLPEALVAQFPTNAIGQADRPVKLETLSEIKASYKAWQKDRVQGSVVVVGATGMGKSTLLAMLEGELEAPVLSAEITTKYTQPRALVAALGGLLGLSPALAGDEVAGPRVFTDEDELIEAICAQPPTIIALDGCHNFFLRQVGGFAAWEAFTRIVNQSCEQVFWVLTFNDAAWDYLRNIAGGVAYFRRVVEIGRWSDEQLRRLLLTRMRRAGYRPNFTDLLVTRIEGVETRAQVIRTSQGYFRLLWDFTDGNPRVATHYWLRSLVPDPDKPRVRVHLFAAPRIEELEELSDDMAFVLTAVVEHENLDADELTAVSNLPADFCRFALDYCCEHGYLREGGGSGRFRLATHWQQPIIRYLKRRHFLYS
ncbi:hypothetical protein [Haliangium sp.]|uniref:hypothetical protein n=1 Tax=Haliangium sp. TaxID=2663208 RepID=UPI003D0E1AAA